jgi:hypothetical protein
LYYSIDYKIEFIQDNSLKSCYLNKYSVEELEAIRDYLSINLAKGFIVSSQALFVSLVLFACKSNGSLWFCVNYCKFNTLTKKNYYPFLLIDKTLARLNRAKVFIKLNIRQVFHRIRISPESKELIAFRIYYGLFEYRVLLFGLTNNLVTFQSYINNILRDLLDVTYTVYLDNILIYSENKL